MCYDRKKSTIDDPSFVAMKVQKSASHYRDAALDEIELLQCINEKMMSSIVISENFYSNEGNHIVRLVDHFDHGGPHGKHVCMVFEMLGENLLKIIKKYDYRGIPIPIVKNFIRQVCMGLDYLHRHCSIIHTDLKPENILVTLAPKPSDLEKVMHLVGNDKPMGSSSSTSTSTSTSKGGDKKMKKIKSAEIGELQEGIDKMSMDGGGGGGGTTSVNHHISGHHNDPTIVKLTAEQKKKLKKKAKKKKQQSKKKGEGETKKGSSTGHRSRKGGHQRNNGETTTVRSKPTEEDRLSDKEQEKLEMMLMELDSTPKEDGDVADSNHHKSSSDNVPSSSSSSHPNKKDLVEEENPDFGVVHEGEERMKMLRLSAFMHLNFESRADYEIEHHRHHSLHMQSKTLPKESYLPPPKPFLASLPMVSTNFLPFCVALFVFRFALFLFSLDHNLRTNDQYSWNAKKYGFR
jgi:hypothetical protein